MEPDEEVVGVALDAAVMEQPSVKLAAVTVTAETEQTVVW